MNNSMHAAAAMVAAVLCLTSPMLVQAQDGSEKNLCWKKNFGRGAGTIPTDCPAGHVKENGLCYTACGAGFTGNGPLCWQSCPAGFADIGVSCTKPAPTSSAGYPWKFGDRAFDFDTGPRSRCEGDHGKDNCYRSGDIWYPKCPANFHKVGDLVCSPDCPPECETTAPFAPRKPRLAASVRFRAAAAA
jgi:hypothetical protein